MTAKDVFGRDFVSPFAIIIAKDDVTDIKEPEFAARFAEEQVFAYGRPGQQALSPVDESIRQLLLTYYDLDPHVFDKLDELPVPTVLLFDEDFVLFGEVDDHTTKIPTLTIMRLAAQPRKANAWINVIYVCQSTVLVATFEELMDKFDAIKNASAKIVDEETMFLDAAQTRHGHELDNSDVDVLNEVLAQQGWLERAATIQIFHEGKWIDTLLLSPVPTSDGNIDIEMFKSGCLTLNDQLISVLDAPLFVHITPYTELPNTKTIPYAFDYRPATGPGRGLS